MVARATLVPEGDHRLDMDYAQDAASVGPGEPGDGQYAEQRAEYADARTSGRRVGQGVRAGLRTATTCIGGKFPVRR
jgi:hypothetical protein